jgi:hypothetical protein
MPGMSVAPLIRRLLDTYDGLNPPATGEALERLGRAFGALSQDVLDLYRAFDGSAGQPGRGDHRLFSRLMPVAEAIEASRELDAVTAKWPRAGAVAWLWYDDSSNWVGVYTDGPLRGWVLRFEHDEPTAEPLWRSVESFLGRWLDSADGTATEEDVAYDLASVPPELPLVEESPAHTAADSALARAFTAQYEQEPDRDRRRFYGRCAMTLTPPSETASLARFLADDDMWTPATAVLIMRRRGFEGAVPALEALVRGRRPNGASAAADGLAAFTSPAAHAALARLASDPDPRVRTEVERAIRQARFAARDRQVVTGDRDDG